VDELAPRVTALAQPIRIDPASGDVVRLLDDPLPQLALGVGAQGSNAAFCSTALARA
jgi:hypothetical protein